MVEGLAFGVVFLTTMVALCLIERAEMRDDCRLLRAKVEDLERSNELLRKAAFNGVGRLAGVLDRMERDAEQGQ